jgi:hypothetical protein
LKMISSLWVLRAGLPNSLLCELDKGWGDDRDDREDDPWRTAARRGFHPEFDAGVERLIWLWLTAAAAAGSRTRMAMTAGARRSCGMH